MFNLTDICLFVYNMYNHLQPCRNGGHLENCQHFTCSTSFKCLGYYCIPWTYVCDGKVDCPEADDENVFIQCPKGKIRCANMYKCSSTQLCSLFVSLCDERPDCPLKDDELLCQLKQLSCPSNCNCLALAIKCIKHKGSLKVYPYLSIFLKNSPTVYEYSKKFQQTILLWIQHSNVSKIGDITFPRTLLFLDMADNIVHSIPGESFHHSQKIKSLSFACNNIEKLAKDTFLYLSQLTTINLSHNPIREVSISNFSLTIRLLNLLGDFFDITDASLFQLVMPQAVQATDYHVCCFVSSKTHCTAEVSWFQSCGDLLEDMASKVGGYIFSALLLVTNLFCIFIHLWKKKEFNKTYQVAVVTVNIHNFLLPSFLSILWVNNLIYQGSYVGFDYLWRRGSTCFAAAGLHLQFVSSSLLLSLFMSLCRLMVVINPITTKFKQHKYVSKKLFIISFISLISTATTTILFYVVHSEMPEKLCIFFHDPTKKSVVIKSVVWVSFVTHVISIILVSSMHIVIQTKSQESHKISTTKVKKGMEVQLLLLSVSIIVCWPSFNIIILAALYLPSYPVSLLSRTFVFIQSSYPIIHPVVLSGFVLKGAAKKKVEFK